MKPNTIKEGLPYHRIASLVFALLSPVFLFSQITPKESKDPFRRLYNAELTYDVSLKYICQEVLAVEHNKVADATIGVVTSAKSGELTTVVYHSDVLRKQGLVFVFWNESLTNELFLEYEGYGFRNFDLSAANTILTRLSEIIEDKKVILEEDNHAVFQYEDVTFIFKDRKTIYVCWNEYRALWNTTNLATTIKRVDRFLKKKNN